MLIPRKPVPSLQAPTLAYSPFDLYSETPESFSLLVFFRGLHCPFALSI